ncbi:CRISPR-associated endonuclease Cas2 [Thermotoga sp. TBGT1766]|jgi:CRISPR-associated protein Cas2|uniref:CRISPR-associated endonuclease Cas2 n=1 Tax=Thermotoga sp. TBGT1766 TaxID=1230478 RepID=UPI000540EEFF|nr:CRISPR-associated endonuclease Cas2 [Thermotoga sp. TBGT1766]AIY88343.1 CRISPR-associated Cas2 family protein [Thermotoga sp. Cell2]KHC95512.1 CRISPR-associated Cas2 family protein [Thermotoga sp. TBGT1765]KHC95825.1 CRISPR-associated Cas2 family protein [Thermotoga sp. TBGT1766]KHC97003.1 CRISPR-associated Cas2 family protein [Thermotoga sp. Xyl54]
MRVILVYDISTETKEGVRRLNRVRKIARRYLDHVQKSVFEGELTEGEIEKLKFELQCIIDNDEDFVIIYKMPPSIMIERDILTNTDDPTSNFI